MKNKREVTPTVAYAKKPPRQKISDAEFRRRLKYSRVEEGTPCRASLQE
ncbi:MAG TPA: hypothetical protein VN743_09770 [Blastocatellia bacterium]|nr:hypothetical protein [Blastocatellia bacterium]